MTASTVTRIVVTLDQPEIAPEVARVVQRLASPAGAEVTLLRVLVPAHSSDTQFGGDLGPLVDLAERRARAELARAGRALDGLSVRPEVIVGADRAREILTWLRGHAVDWVVMTAHERRGFRRLFGRSVAETVRAASPAPVIAVHAARAWPPGRLILHPAARGRRAAGAY